jgi:hypothetical protein
VEEVTHGDSKSVLDVRKEVDGLVGPLGGERLAGRPPLATSRPPPWASAARASPGSRATPPSQSEAPRFSPAAA